MVGMEHQTPTLCPPVVSPRVSRVKLPAMTKSQRLRQEAAQEAANFRKNVNAPSTRKRFKNLPWTKKNFDVRQWQKEEVTGLLSPVCVCPEKAKQIIAGTSAADPTLAACPDRPQITVRQGKFGARRDQNKEHFVEGWLTQVGLNCDVNKQLTHILTKRIGKRLVQLGLGDYASQTPLAAYDQLLRQYPSEWIKLVGMARIHFTTFNRDKCFERLHEKVMPGCIVRALEDGRPSVAVWCAGCSTGEEPYSLALHWELGRGKEGAVASAEVLMEASMRGKLRSDGYDSDDWNKQQNGSVLQLQITATDSSVECIERGSSGLYDARPWASFGSLPATIRDRGTIAVNATATCSKMMKISPDIQKMVSFHVQDLKHEVAEGTFDLILCRNCAFMYFDDDAQTSVIRRFAQALHPGGHLVLGKKDRPIDFLEAGRELFERIDPKSHEIWVKKK